MSAPSDGPVAHGKKLGDLPLGSDAVNGHHAAGGVTNGVLNGAHTGADAAQSPRSAEAEERSLANSHHLATAQDSVLHAANSKGRVEPEQALAGALQNGALNGSSQQSEQTREGGVAQSNASVTSSASRHAPSDTIRAALRAGLRVQINGKANTGSIDGHGTGQRSSSEACTDAAAPVPQETAGAANDSPAGHHAPAAGTAELERRSASSPPTPHPPSSSPEAGAADGGAAAAGEEGSEGGSGGRGAQSPGRSRSAGSVERGILRKSAALTVQREAVKGYLIHRSAASTRDSSSEVPRRLGFRVKSGDAASTGVLHPAIYGSDLSRQEAQLWGPRHVLASSQPSHACWEIMRLG